MNLPKLVRLGAISLVVSALLLLGWSVLSALSGPPPAGADQMAAWIASHSLTLALSDECLSFASFFLIPGCLGLVTQLWNTGERPILTVLGGSCVALVVINLSLMNIALGRLVYPVFGLAVGPDALALSVSAFYGALHQSDLLWAAAVGLFGFSLSRLGKAPWFFLFSLFVAVAELAAAYPWLFSSEATFLLRLPLVVWLGLVGLEMLGIQRQQGSSERT